MSEPSYSMMAWDLREQRHAREIAALQMRLHRVNVQAAAKALYELWYAPLNWESNCPADGRPHFLRAVYVVKHALEAQAGETRRAETSLDGSVHEHATPQRGDAP